MLRRSLLLVCTLIASPLAALGDTTTTFENTGLAANSFNNNAGSSGAFNIDGNSFNNSFTPSSYGDYWSGWALSSTTDKTTPGAGNQYSSITGSGAGGSQTYIVADTYGNVANGFHPNGSIINLAAGMSAKSVMITNTTYAYDAFRDGDPYGFAKAFQPGDFQTLDIQGLNAVGQQVGDVTVSLADYRNGQTFLLNTWVSVDLSSLSGATELVFGLTSSKNNAYGLLTPAYFALDNLVTTNAVTVPEPASLTLEALALTVGVLVHRRRRIA